MIGDSGQVTSAHDGEFVGSIGAELLGHGAQGTDRMATGRPRVSDRQVINGMVYKIRTGISWRDLPERYGPWQTVYTCFRRYALDGVFTQALQQIQARADAAGDIDWLVQIDSTIVRSHQHAAATGRKGAPMSLVKVVGSVSGGSGSVAVVSDDVSVRGSADEGMRPCDFCGHPVVIDSVDERDCPVCGEGAEVQPEVAGWGS
ncbi:transposase [Streptomyces yerevanensis]|uniref:transposase n=1 Tax=Streptomyces yerevanensis TaxID=66378 RepID=UPI000D11CB79|nr:transposase [Streptomyces yerevanensis]